MSYISFFIFYPYSLFFTCSDFFWSVWELLLSLSLARTETPLLRFSLAEGLVRMSAVRFSFLPSSLEDVNVHCEDNNLTETSQPVGPSLSHDISNDVIVLKSNFRKEEEENLPVLMRVLLGIIETVVADGPFTSFRTGISPEIVSIKSDIKSTFDKSTAGVLLLVLIKQSAAESNINPSLNYNESVFPKFLKLQAVPRKEMIRATELFLHLLREKDAFLQDICCAGLCYLFNSAIRLDEALKLSDTQTQKGLTISNNLLSVIIGREVISTLTREKRVAQTAGKFYVKIFNLFSWEYFCLSFCFIYSKMIKI